MSEFTFKNAAPINIGAVTKQAMHATLDQMADICQRFVRYRDANLHDPNLIALWCACTFGFAFNERKDVTWEYFPRLVITAPDEGAGKSTQATIIEAMSYKAFHISKATEASALWLMDEVGGTLILDEMDVYVKDKYFRSAFNIGYQRAGAKVIKMNDSASGGVLYEVYSPLVISGVKATEKLDRTTRSRCIIINLMKSREPVPHMSELEKLRGDCGVIANNCYSFIMNNADDLRKFTLAGTREAHNFEPLCAIAELVGGAWPDKPRAARDCAPAMPKSQYEVLFAHIYRYFQRRPEASAVWQKDLVKEIYKEEDKSWLGEHEAKVRSEGEAQEVMRKLLAADGIGIKAKQKKMNGGNNQGYDKAAFEALFDLYVVRRSGDGR